MDTLSMITVFAPPPLIMFPTARPPTFPRPVPVMFMLRSTTGRSPPTVTFICGLFVFAVLLSNREQSLICRPQYMFAPPPIAGTEFSENEHRAIRKFAPDFPSDTAPTELSLPLLRRNEQSCMSKPRSPKLRREAYSKSRLRMRVVCGPSYRR